ncbi:MAG TPA: PGPGW domain-containing protein [Labilithrix sp.]|nr:PGPGW domain-containing protein [Labilithrix sp.]
MTQIVGLIFATASIAMFVGTLAAIPWLVRRLPADYFVRPPPSRSVWSKISRNALGAALVTTGSVMLVLPGQGILTILLGASIMDLPIKHRLVRRMLEVQRVREGVQRLRVKLGQPPFVFATHAP